MQESKITQKGQTTIPKKIRKEVGLKPGDTVRYSVRDGIIQIRPLVSAKSLFGALKYEGPQKTEQEIAEAFDEALREKWVP